MEDEFPRQGSVPRMGSTSGADEVRNAFVRFVFRDDFIFSCRRHDRSAHEMTQYNNDEEYPKDFAQVRTPRSTPFDVHGGK